MREALVSTLVKSSTEVRHATGELEKLPQEFHLLILDGLANRHIRDFDDHLDDWQGRRGVLLQPCQSGRLCIRDPA